MEMKIIRTQTAFSEANLTDRTEAGREDLSNEDRIEEMNFVLDVF